MAIKLNKYCKDENNDNSEDELEIEVGRKRLEQVNSLEYLGCRVTKDVDCDNEVTSRLAIRLAWSKSGRTGQSATVQNYVATGHIDMVSSKIWLQSLD